MPGVDYMTVQSRVPMARALELLGFVAGAGWGHTTGTDSKRVQNGLPAGLGDRCSATRPADVRNNRASCSSRPKTDSDLNPSTSTSIAAIAPAVKKNRPVEQPGGLL